MSDEEEDYLSDKFLVEAAAEPSQPKTYAQRRQESLKQSRIKNEENRLKSRRQREEESREEGLRKSLFERGNIGNPEREGSKALGIMLKMGFKIGQSLGRNEPTTPQEGTPGPPGSDGTPSDSTHRAEPLPLNEWSGKQGIGLGKRPRSPSVSDRLAKMAKMAEDATKEIFRDQARLEYEEKRAESRLAPAQRTCTTLDETAGITFNILWMNPNDVDAVPKGLMDALWESAQGTLPGNEEVRLRDQMRADALQPVTSPEDDDHASYIPETNKAATQQETFPVETVQEAVQFLRLGPRDRLSLVLAYLRNTYAYCFWCGTKYEDEEELSKHCPGPSEQDHD